MTDHNAMYQYRPPGWDKAFTGLASNDFKLLSEVYEHGADKFITLMLDSEDSVYAIGGEKPFIPVKPISGNWVFIPDEQFDEDTAS